MAIDEGKALNQPPRIETVRPGLGEPNDVTLVYDGDCPVCKGYSRALCIRRDIGELRLVDARKNRALVSDLSDRGVALNEGFALIMGGEIYSGVDAMHILALISGRIGVLNKANHAIFKHRSLAITLYPVLRFGRNMLLRILGRRPIGAVFRT
jgi:predicted DCC family thiol-disulfide oxidoreductase YuxK